MLLIDRGDPGGFRQPDLAAVRHKLAQDQLEQRGFPDPIAPDQADLGADRQRYAGGIKKAPIPGVEYEIIDLEHGKGAPKGKETVAGGDRPFLTAGSPR